MIRETEIAAASVATPPANTKTLFLDSADGEFKTKDESGTVESLKGDQGDPGDPGDPGADGNNLLVDSGAPDDGDGNDADVYIDLTTGDVYVKASGTWGSPVGTLPGGGGGGGAVVQVVNTQTGAVATGATSIPLDDTIPQNTEGDEYMTLAITPTSATNKLRIDVVWFGSVASASEITVALFQDSTANALAATSSVQVTATGRSIITLTHYMTAGTTSATTFKVRAGPNAGATLTFNGMSGTRLYGGAAASSITITEIIP